jgi:PAS domain S-box-containing protein
MVVVTEPTSTLVRLRELTEELSTTEQQLHNFFQKSIDLLAIVGVDGSFYRHNPAWQKILGWTEEELAERSWLSLVHPDDQRLIREMTNILDTTDAWRFCCRIQGRDRRYRVVEFSATQWDGGLSNLIGRLVPDACLSCPEALPRFYWRANGDNTCKQSPQ